MHRNLATPLAIALVLAGLGWIAWQAAWRAGDAAAPAGTDPVSPAPSDRGARGGAAEPAAVQAASTGATTAREVLGGAEGPPAPGPAQEQASLEVLVVREGTGEPLPGVRVGASTFEGGRVAPPARWVASDVQGRALLDVPAGRRLLLRAEPDPAYAGSPEPVDELAPRERRAVELQLELASEQVFHGRVVAEEDGAPIPEARVFRDAPGSLFSDLAESAELARGTPLAISGEDGHFLFEGRDTLPPVLEVRAEGFAALRFTVREGHRTPAQARELRLSRAGRLVVRVAGAAGEPLQVGVTSRGHLFPEGESFRTFTTDGWRACLDEDGAAAFEDLPPHVQLAVELHRGQELLRSHRVQPPLAPGETRELALSLAGSRLHGRLGSADGAPIAGRELWLLPRPDAWGDVERRPYREGERGQLGSARTDSAGRFELRDVAPGRYWIGPAPRRDASWLPLALAVDVPEGGGDVPVDLVLPEAHYIAGQVVGSGDAPLVDVRVHAEQRGLGSHASTRVDAAGRFRVGPLHRGDHAVQASAHDGGESELQLVPAGTADLVLRLIPGARVSGRMVDAATSEPLAGTYYFYTDEDARQGESEDGTFELALKPGSYLALAVASGSRIATPLPIVVAPGQVVEDLELRVGSGATLSVHSRGSEPGFFLVRWHEHLVALDSLLPGTVTSRTVPPGALEVQLYLAGELHSIRRVAIATGEELDVVFEP